MYIILSSVRFLTHRQSYINETTTMTQPPTISQHITVWFNNSLGQVSKMLP